jgi:hypothetical protein
LTSVCFEPAETLRSYRKIATTDAAAPLPSLAIRLAIPAQPELLRYAGLAQEGKRDTDAAACDYALNLIDAEMRPSRSLEALLQVRRHCNRSRPCIFRVKRERGLQHRQRFICRVNRIDAVVPFAD